MSEFGWGEFETRIQLHFHDATEKPVDIIHMLVLYPPNNLPASTKKVTSVSCALWWDDVLLADACGLCMHPVGSRS